MLENQKVQKLEKLARIQGILIFSEKKRAEHSGNKI